MPLMPMLSDHARHCAASLPSGDICPLMRLSSGRWACWRPATGKAPPPRQRGQPRPCRQQRVRDAGRARGGVHLSNWRVWARAPTAELLAAARRNSELGDWLEALPGAVSEAGADDLQVWREPGVFTNHLVSILVSTLV
jgi:hypothetical protein